MNFGLNRVDPINGRMRHQTVSAGSKEKRPIKILDHTCSKIPENSVLFRPIDKREGPAILAEVSVESRPDDDQRDMEFEWTKQHQYRQCGQ